jgi:SAM-dependent methyltransferase
MKKSEKIEKIIKAEAQYTIQNKAYCFLKGDRKPIKTAGDGLLAEIQHRLKSFELYVLLVTVFSPVMPTRTYQKNLKDVLSEYGDEHVVLNIGSGASQLKQRKDIINIDLFAFNHVDLVSDACDLPIQNNKVDIIFNIAMLEHSQTPESVVKEMYRVLKPGGKVFSYIPFIVPFHAAPNDYFRWTKNGAKELFSSFANVHIFMGAGPTSGLLWIFEQWFAMLLSFGNRKLHDLFLLLLLLLLFPLKYMDILFNRYSYSSVIASGFGIIAQKDRADFIEIAPGP